MDEKRKKEIEDKFSRFCAEISENDTSIITMRLVCTSRTGTNSGAFHCGFGEWYSFIGYLHDILRADAERTRIETRRNEKETCWRDESDSDLKIGG